MDWTELLHVLQNELLETIATDPGERIVLLAYAQSKQVQEAIEHVLEALEEVRKQTDHVPKGLDERRAQPYR